MILISVFHISLLLWNMEGCNWYHYVSIQRSSKRMSAEEEGLRPMSGESCCPVGESKQDIDQRTQVIEGVVLPERVVSELVLHFSLPTSCYSGHANGCSVALPLMWSILAALHDGLQDVSWTVQCWRTLAAAIVPYASVVMLVAVWDIFQKHVVFVLLLHVISWTICLQPADRQNHSLSVCSVVKWLRCDDCGRESSCAAKYVAIVYWTVIMRR